jgi:hypothetical protein
MKSLLIALALAAGFAGGASAGFERADPCWEPKYRDYSKPVDNRPWHLREQTECDKRRIAEDRERAKQQRELLDAAPSRCTTFECRVLDYLDVIANP